MTVTLSPDQLAWIEARVAKGDYPDVEEAVRDLLATGIAEHEEAETDDMAWAKPLVDEALAAIERGEFEIVEDTDAYIDAIFRAAEAR